MALGFFGWTPQVTPQPRWLKGRDFGAELELARAQTEAMPTIRRFSWAQAHEGPAYSGGVLDAWPAHDVHAFSLLKTEATVIEAVQAIEAKKKARP